MTEGVNPAATQVGAGRTERLQWQRFVEVTDRDMVQPSLASEEWSGTIAAAIGRGRRPRLRYTGHQRTPY